MKRVNIGISVICSLAFAVTSVGVISAQETGAAQETNAANQAEIKARVEERRKKVKPTLNAAEATRIKDKCASAQGKTKLLENRLKDSYDPYQNRYDAYTKKLDSLTKKLEADGKDVTELKAQTATLAEKYAAFQASLEQLKVSTADLTAMDCKAEPNGFKATLEELRTQLKATQASFKEVNSYAKQTIKATLQGLKDSPDAE